MMVEWVKLEVLMPKDLIVEMRNALNELGILTVGNYDHVVSYTLTEGYWRPLETAAPFEGQRGEISFGHECKLEFRCPYLKVIEAMSVIKQIHPYEEPIINVIPLLNEGFIRELDKQMYREK